MTEFTFAPGEKNIIGDRFSPSVIIFWLKTSIAASSTRIQYTTPNTMSAQLDFVNQAGGRNSVKVSILEKDKLAALAAGLALILALIVWFWYDHSKPDFAPCFWGSIGVIVASILIRAFAEWILERPTRAKRRAMKRAAAQETGRVTMRMPVSEEVAAAFESTRDGRRASL